jgi:uncharacterized membrane protein
MNWPYIHLVINHFPVILSIVGGIAAIVAAVTGSRSTWLYAAVTLALAGITVVPTYLTGDQAGDIMVHQSYVVRDVLHEHDDAAGWALWMGIAAGIAGLWAWWTLVRAPDQQLAGWLRAALVVLGLFALTTTARTAYLGGRIVYESPALGGHGVGPQSTPASGIAR